MLDAIVTKAVSLFVLFCLAIPDIGAVIVICVQGKVCKYILICVSLLVGPSVPPAVSYTKRGQALSVESDHREEWDGARRLELSTSKGDVPASPLGVQERKKTTSAVGVRKWGTQHTYNTCT